ncbi:MAG TPA: hypothetical protein VIM24_10405 [Candidatus Limnocylindrales bacterium]
MIRAPDRAKPGGLTGPRRIAILAGIVVAMVIFAAVAAIVLGGPGRRVETGVVVGVEATGLTSVQGFSIRTADGRTVDFRIGTLENGATFPPGHLGEHRVTLVPIRVTYVDQDGMHVAVRLEDAP